MAKISSQPKKKITKLNANRKTIGNTLRQTYQNTILDKMPIFPMPLEYADIDKAFFDFVENIIELNIDGKRVPTYTLYSNQRFSEYSQMWEHSDENGNLYLNFKTVNREKNPSFGENQGSLWNIPGQRRYTLFQRDVLDKNGTESTEIYTMKQPYAVNLSYVINFVTTTIDNLNKFNQKLNKIFSARQYYIRPNGHFIPMVIDDISDETAYSVSDRKFYVQSASIKLMAYIIEKDDFEIKKYPKRSNILMSGDLTKRLEKSCVEIEELETPLKNKAINVNISFNAYNNKTLFVFDTDMTVNSVITKNIRNFRIMINDELFYTDKGFKLHCNDEVRVQIKPIEEGKESMMQFIGVDDNLTYVDSAISESVKDEPITVEEITIK